MPVVSAYFVLELTLKAPVLFRPNQTQRPTAEFRWLSLFEAIPFVTVKSRWHEMKKLQCTLVCFLLVVAFGEANAKYFTSLAGPGVEITKYFTHSGGGVTLHVTGDIVNADGCEVTNRVHLKGDLPGHKAMTSAALTAFVSGKKIGLHASGCEEIPFWGSDLMTPIIDNLWVF